MDRKGQKERKVERGKVPLSLALLFHFLSIHLFLTLHSAFSFHLFVPFFLSLFHSPTHSFASYLSGLRAPVVFHISLFRLQH